MSKDNYDVCDNCGRKRNEETEPHCKDCGHDHTTTKRDYDRQLANNAKNVCEKCGYGWVDDKQPGCKKCGHDMSIKRELYKERQKTAFDIVVDSFEKIAKQMPYTLPSGEYAIPKGWYAGPEEEDSWERGYFRDEHKIPMNYKRIADDGFGNSTFVDVNSDKNNPDYYDWDHETTELTKWTDKDKVNAFTASDNGHETYKKLKGYGVKAGRDIDNMSMDTYKSLGFTGSKEPSLLSKAVKTGKGLYASHLPQAGGVLGALLATPANAQSLKEVGKKSGKGLLVGAAIGTGLAAGVNAWAGDYKKRPKTDELKQFKDKLKEQYYNGLDEDEFISQYKSASSIVEESFEKIAGVEYGFRAYNDPDGKLSKALSDASLNDDWNAEDSIRNQLKSKGSHDYGYKWSEKGIATLPYEYGHNDLRSLMDGKGTSKLKGYHPLKSGYTGESDGSSFLAGRESAQIMLNHYNDMLNKLPNESVYNEQKYNEMKGKHDALNAKIKDIESKKENELGKYKQQYNDLYSKLLQENSSWENEPIAKQVFNIPGKIKHKKAVKNILNERKNVQDKMDEVRLQGGATQEDLDKLHQYRNEMYKATDRDIIEQYKLSLQKSLEDKNNNMYEWGWY